MENALYTDCHYIFLARTNLYSFSFSVEMAKRVAGKLIYPSVLLIRLEKRMYVVL